MDKEKGKVWKSKHANVWKAACKYLYIQDYCDNIGIYPTSGNMYIETNVDPEKNTTHGSYGRYVGSSLTTNRIRTGTRQYYILGFIASYGEEGVRYSDIQRFLLGLEDKAPLKTGRGYYSTWLSYKMPRWCDKDEKTGKWALTDKNLIEHFKLIDAS
jgi:hypothetical protein